jgi:chromosome segregation ATPase
MSGLCSLLPFITGLGSAALGGMIGWHWLKRTQLAKMLGVIDQKDNDYAQLQAAHQQNDIRYRSLQGDYALSQNAKKDWESKYTQTNDAYRRLDGIKLGLSNEFDAFKGRAAQTQTDLESQLREAKVRIQTMEADLKNLKTDYETVIGQNKAFIIQVAKMSTEYKNLDAAFAQHKAVCEKQIKTLTTERSQFEKQFTGERTAHEQSRKDLSAKLAVEQVQLAESQAQLEQEKNKHTNSVADWDGRFRLLNTQFEAEKAAHSKTRSTWEQNYKTLTFDLEVEKRRMVKPVPQVNKMQMR